MFLLLIILLLGPAFVSVFLFERFKGYRYTLLKRFMLLFVFAFLINMVGYATLWVWGWDYHYWSLGSTSALTSVSFVLRYMGVSLASSVALAYILSFVRVGKMIRLNMTKKQEYILSAIIVAATVFFVALYMLSS